MKTETDRLIICGSEDLYPFFSNRLIKGIVTTSICIKLQFKEKTNLGNRDEEEIMDYRDVLNMMEYDVIRPSYILQLH